MDISSDSEDSILLTNEPSDSEIENILKKYTTTSSSTITTSSCQDNSEDKGAYFNEEYFSWSQQVTDYKNYNDNYTFTSVNTEDVTPSGSNVIDIDFDEKSHSVLEKPEAVQLQQQGKTNNGNRRKEKSLEKTRKRQEAEMKRVEKNLEKERKKETMEKQRMIKNALRDIAKSTKPEECIKYTVVEVDPENEHGFFLKEACQKKEIPFRNKSQVLPNLISWSRKMQTIDNTLLKEPEVNEDYFLLIINAKEFTDHVNKDTLIVHIQQIFSLLRCKQLTLAVLGIEKTKPAQEMALIEAQMLTKSYFRFIKDIEGLSDLVMEVTKSVAQVPYKLKKEEKYKLHNEYFSDSNKDTVKIDKNGNGLGRLWHQMLTMFPLARLETAEAITTVYPTPASLFQAYEHCESNKEDLLQDLTIRRAQGPCTTGRRIGPELSRKCFNFFCSTDNKFL